jgi:hypothetical protein
MKINFYDKSFYLIYCFYKRMFGKKELPVLTSVIVLAGTTFLQIAMVGLFFSLFFNEVKVGIKLINRVDIVFCIVLFLGVFQGLYFFQTKRYYKIILKLRNSGKIYNNQAFYRYIFINVLCLIGLIISVVLSVQ